MQELIYRLKRAWHYFKTGLWGGAIGQLKYHHPEKKLKIIAITGTDGKTTTATLTYQLLKGAGYKVGLISTVAAYIDDEVIDTGFHVTSANPRDLYKFMHQMVEKGLEYLVLEVTSHGAYQYRTWGIKPYIAALTNLDYEHLDYHLTKKNYLEAKMLILKQAEIVVLNEDQDYFPIIKKALPSSTKILTFGKHKRFGATIEKAIRQYFPEDFNRLNAALATTIARQFEISEKVIAQVFSKFKLPMGRMEFIDNDLDVNLIVDFAHTSQALESALKSIRKNYAKKGLLISVFGCAGLRDVAKRPRMGRIGAELSDIAIFTAEDPRTENVWVIINQMKSNLKGYHDRVISVPNREEAIKFALQNYAKAGNTIAIFGKGHEQSMCYGTTEKLWNDITGTKELLKELKK